jgi:PREDICTED: similar to ankyrin repeat domain 54
LFSNYLAECKLRTAASLNKCNAVRQLLDCGVNINCCDKRQRTPLHLAASKGHVETGMAELIKSFIF